jgi:class 3 adenylate cyclase
VGQWLDDLGLGRYRHAFFENGVDGRALPHLTDSDLQDLGVLLRHRRILLAEISKLADQKAAEALAPMQPEAPVEAERRGLTVMFCDMVGSTELSGELDGENYRELISAFYQCCAEAVERYAGFVAKFLGDGLLAHFGYPAAHEDDARRAARAALDIVSEASRREACS